MCNRPLVYLLEGAVQVPAVTAIEPVGLQIISI